MSIIYILIPIAVLFTALGVYLFFWAVKSDQFEDLEKQGLSILFDDDDIKKTTNVNMDNKTSPKDQHSSSNKEK